MDWGGLDGIWWTGKDSLLPLGLFSNSLLVKQTQGLFSNLIGICNFGGHFSDSSFLPKLVALSFQVELMFQSKWPCSHGFFRELVCHGCDSVDTGKSDSSKAEARSC